MKPKVIKVNLQTDKESLLESLRNEGVEIAAHYISEDLWHCLPVNGAKVHLFFKRKPGRYFSVGKCQIIPVAYDSDIECCTRAPHAEKLFLLKKAR